MIHLLPERHFTLVSPYSIQEITTRIRARTQPPKWDRETGEPVFNGIVSKNRFTISHKVRSGHNSLPLVRGRIEATASGAIIFLRMGLFPAAKGYLVSSSVLAFTIGIVFFTLADAIAAGIVSFLAGGVNYLILQINFQRKAKETFYQLSQILSPIS